MGNEAVDTFDQAPSSPAFTPGARSAPTVLMAVGTSATAIIRTASGWASRLFARKLVDRLDATLSATIAALRVHQSLERADLGGLHTQPRRILRPPGRGRKSHCQTLLESPPPL